MPVTAADLVSDLTQLLYVAAFVGTLVELVRRPRRASIDAALFFGILAVIVVIAQSLRYLQVSLSPAATTVLVAMLLALPYALLRLADDYRGVPRGRARPRSPGSRCRSLCTSRCPLRIRPGWPSSSSPTSSRSSCTAPSSSGGGRWPRRARRARACGRSRSARACWR